MEQIFCKSFDGNVTLILRVEICEYVRSTIDRALFRVAIRN